MAHGHTGGEYIPPPGMKHETKDVSTRIVIWFAVSLVVAAAVIHVVIWLLQLYLGSLQAKAYPRQYPMAQVGAPPQPPAPRLQTRPREELKQMRAEEDRVLHGYGWADQEAGRVQIPIEEAMRLLERRGLPARADSQGPGPGLPQDSSSGRTWTGGVARQ